MIQRMVHDALECMIRDVFRLRQEHWVSEGETSSVLCLNVRERGERRAAILA